MGKSTPDDLMAVAESVAQELLGLPIVVRERELARLKREHRSFYTLVVTKIRNARGTA